MAKAINNDGTWFQEVSPTSFYNEEDLERAIIQNLEIIFPQFKAFTFKKSLLNAQNLKKNRPDLAMVKEDYSEWYIIEVELGNHNLTHVEEQIDTFYNCNYGDEHASYIAAKKDTLDIDQLKNMIATKVPEFMVIVNEPMPSWVEALKDYRCKVCIFQIYHDINGNPLYRLNGEHPYIYTHFCHCRYQKIGSPYTVEVLENTFLDSYGIVNGDEISIEFKGKNSKWTRLDDSDKVFLNCDTTHPPLDPLSDRYKLNYNTELNLYSFTKD